MSKQTLYHFPYDSNRVSRGRFPVLLLFSGGTPNARTCPWQNGEAKFWLEPQIELAQNYGLSQKELSEALHMLKEHEHDIRSAWHKHFGS